MKYRNFIIWTVVGTLLAASLFMANQGQMAEKAQELSYTDFMEAVETGDIKSVVISDIDVSGERANGILVKSEIAWLGGSDFAADIEAAGGNVSFQSKTARSGGWMSMVGSALPFILVMGLLFFMMRGMQGGGRGAMSFGKSRAKMLTEKEGRVTFDDVAGVDEAKEELEEVVEFLQDPSKFQRLGGKIPKGALLVGPPGTGKTLLARAVAGEANVPFFTISGSDFVEMFVGVGASRVRDMFEQAKESAPCIIFIDEIDAVGRSRGSGMGGGNDEREQTLNQLLVEMDGFSANEGIILIAATNRPDVLDSALLRPGRFDRQVTVGNPDLAGREEILKVHMRNVPLASDVDPRVIARGTPGFSGAALANLVNEASLLAARGDQEAVDMTNFEEAKDKVLMGPERKTMVMSDDEKRLTAWHEAGHAIVAVKVPAADPVHKATIIPRGRALGMVMQLPEEDQYSMSRVKMTSLLAIMMGGRVAEEEKFGEDEVTSGASSDIQQATRLARSMVTRWGFSEQVGPIDYGEADRGKLMGMQNPVSEETARLIEEEVRGLVQKGMDDARQIITEFRDGWSAIAEGLLEFETLTGEEIMNLLDGQRPERPDVVVAPKAVKPKSAVPQIGKKLRGGGNTGGAMPEPA